jgi:hypothetical protein
MALSLFCSIAIFTHGWSGSLPSLARLLLSEFLLLSALFVGCGGVVLLIVTLYGGSFRTWLNSRTIGRFAMADLFLRIRNYRKTSTEISKTPRRPRGLAPVYALLWMVVTLGLAFAINRSPKYPVETHHNVYVWSQVKGVPGTWWISSEDGLPFNTWKCCPDFPCNRNIWPGYIADTLKYEERGECKSIRASGLGVWWKTNEYGDVKEW